MDDRTQAAAGLWPRSLAFALDLVPIAVYLAALAAVGLTVSVLLPSLSETLFGGPLVAEVFGFVTLTLPVIVYFALSESSTWQASWGKKRMNLVVADMSGNRIGLARSMLRSTLKFVPWELAHFFVWRISFSSDPSSSVYAWGFGAVWLLVGANVVAMVVTTRKRTVYDVAAGTVVVKE
ncbi:MAG: RDD family protein [Coriobacteriia bacterium]|nr:RDD family protein [Coriobacteriia bacterium]